MTRPADDELEVLVDAVWSEYRDSVDNKWVFRKEHVENAMLRACKTGDAPDHAEWNAAIEAAAKEIDCGCDGSCMYPHVCPKEDVESILTLKKGQTND